MSNRISWKYFTYFFLSAIVISGLSSLLLHDSFRKYEAEARIVVIAKSAAVAPARDVAANLEFFSETDSYRRLFLERVREGRGVIDGEVSVRETMEQFGYPASVRRDRAGSSLSVSGYADDPETAREIAREASLALFLFAGQYYNVKEEADFRIVDISAARYGIVDVIPYLVSSLSFGFGIVALGYLIVFGISSMRVSGRHPSIPSFDHRIFTPKRPAVESLFDRDAAGTSPEGMNDGEDEAEEGAVEGIEEEVMEAEVGSPVESEAIAETTPIPAPEEEAVASELVPEAVTVSESTSETEADESALETESHPTSVATSEKKGAAPSNLPGGMTEAEKRFLNEFSFEGEAVKAEADEAEEGSEETVGSEDAPEGDLVPSVEPETEGVVSADTNDEPTEEEYRRRLNELLGK